MKSNVYLIGFFALSLSGVFAAGELLSQQDADLVIGGALGDTCDGSCVTKEAETCAQIPPDPVPCNGENLHCTDVILHYPENCGDSENEDDTCMDLENGPALSIYHGECNYYNGSKHCSWVAEGMNDLGLCPDKDGPDCGAGGIALRTTSGSGVALRTTIGSIVEL